VEKLRSKLARVQEKAKIGEIELKTRMARAERKVCVRAFVYVYVCVCVWPRLERLN
jgi:hypothetical protein